ncbi:hypothetical protein D9613_009463 [Agrocybe pediades]|uniref:Uncharacterized protein n=1 Tax=Agrocybe pediades TaxID=84607 RepID=A0A8H4VVR6_9AGAR|nr:hypothetical protein D9613_009463 [Agrocybe pediades]
MLENPNKREKTTTTFWSLLPSSKQQPGSWLGLYPIHAITPKAGLQSARTINRKFHQPGTHSPYVISWLPLSKEQHEIIIVIKFEREFC